MNLLDTIKQNQQAAMQDNTAQTQNLLRAKSGKAVGSGGAGMSSLQEQSAVDQNTQANQQVAQTAGMQQQAQQLQMGQLNQQEQQGRDNAAMKQRAQQATQQISSDEILNNLARDRSTLSAEQQQAQLEQAAFILRMQDTQYVDNLEAEGSRNRLDNQLEFQKASKQAAFKDEQSLLSDGLARAAMAANTQREFDMAMAKARLSDLMDTSYRGMDDAAARARIQGYTSAATTAAGAAAKAYKPGASTTASGDLTDTTDTTESGYVG